MRIRSIRPEYWSSEDVAAMDWNTRLIFIGLWSYVDDNGVGRDIERLIVAALFPLDEDLQESSRRVTGALRHLSSRGQIVRYTVDDKPYLHVTAWSRHQRIEKASKGRYPLPTCENAQIRQDSPTTPGALPDMSPPGEGEKGRRGEGEKKYSAPSGATDLVVIDAEIVEMERPRNAGTLVAEWIDHCTNPPLGRIKGQLAKNIKTLLDEGVPYEAVRRGVAEWHAKAPGTPSQLPSFVQEVLNPPTRPRWERQTRQTAEQAATDDMFAAAMARAEAAEARGEIA